MKSLTPILIITPILLLLASYGMTSRRVLHEEFNRLVDVTFHHNYRKLKGSQKIVFDPKTVQSKENLGQPTITVPIDEDQLCTARVDDGTIITESVIGTNGDFELALPEGYKAIATVECTKYVRLDPPPSERSETVEKYVKMPPRPVVYVPPSPENCKSTDFRAGYFDLRTNSWHDHCTGRTSADRNPQLPLSKEICPLLRNRNDDIWVHIVGDSVGNAWFEALKTNVDIDNHAGRSFWKSGIWRGRADTELIPFAKMNDDDARIWATFRYDGAIDALTSKHVDLWAHTWGDFVRVRGNTGRNPVDPRFSEDKVPDFIFWGPGYHASSMDGPKFGMMADNMLTLIQENARMANPPVMPQIYLLLNIMPAPWLIPEHYTPDVEYRTLLNEYRKNLGMIEAAKKHFGSGSVRGVVDAFSMELPFNGKEGGETVHSDAVHMYGAAGDKINKAVSSRIIDTICHSEGLLAQ